MSKKIEMKTIYVTVTMHRELKNWASAEQRSIVNLLRSMMDVYRSKSGSPAKVDIVFDFYPYTLLVRGGHSAREVDERNKEYNTCFSLLSARQAWDITKMKREAMGGCAVDENLRSIPGGELSMSERLRRRKEIKDLWIEIKPEHFKEPNYEDKEEPIGDSGEE